jgi:hypothetical protein
VKERERERERGRERERDRERDREREKIISGQAKPFYLSCASLLTGPDEEVPNSSQQEVKTAEQADG